jgi:hypothetical protein
MRSISCAAGHVPIELGQEWALRIELEEEVHFLIVRVEEFSNNQVLFEFVRTEWFGEETDPVQPMYQKALDEFGYNGKLYFASMAWSNLWKNMLPNPQ